MRLDLSILPICEGYGRVVDMEYGNPGTPGDHRSAKPTVLQLGNWRHPKTKNMLVGGINLAYLSDEKKLVLRRYLPDILASKNLKGRYWAGRLDVPNRLRKLGKKKSANELAEIFAFYYRTYNKAHVNTISTKTLRFMSPSELKALGDKEDTDIYHALKGKAGEIAAIRKEIEAIRDAGGDASDLEKKLGVALGELPVKARKKLEKPPEPPPPVSPRMGVEPKAPEAEPETVKARAQDTVDSNVARDNIAQLDPDDKKKLISVEPTKDAAEPEEGEKPEISKPEEPEIEMSSTEYDEPEDEGVKPDEDEGVKPEEPEIEMSSTEYEEDEE